MSTDPKSELKSKTSVFVVKVQEPVEIDGAVADANDGPMSDPDFAGTTYLDPSNPGMEA